MTPVYRLTAILLIPLLTSGLSGCASYTAVAAKKLDPNHPRYQREECVASVEKKVEVQEDIKLARTVATPVVLLLSAGLALPVVAANVGLDVNDQRTAAQLTELCSDKKVGNEDIAIEVGKNAALSAVTQSLGIMPSESPIKIQTDGR